MSRGDIFFKIKNIEEEGKNHIIKNDDKILFFFREEPCRKHKSRGWQRYNLESSSCCCNEQRDNRRTTTATTIRFDHSRATTITIPIKSNTFLSTIMMRIIIARKRKGKK